MAKAFSLSLMNQVLNYLRVYSQENLSPFVSLLCFSLLCTSIPLALLRSFLSLTFTFPFTFSVSTQRCSHPRLHYSSVLA